jgi:rhodanese-related sulfurtransferase
MHFQHFYTPESSIACSLLARAGFMNVMNVQGGTEAWMRQREALRQ